MHKYFERLNKDENGLTLMEMVLVIGMIGVLSGIMLNVVNSDRQQQYARDAVRRSNIEKLALGIESFFGGEGRYPTSQAEAASNIYIQTWPDDAVYRYVVVADGFYLHVPLSTDAELSLKYSSVWRGIRECDTSEVTAGLESCLVI